jgi:hypothetical protein
LATNYFANTHPSIGNYFMLTTGNIETNNDTFTGTVSSDSIPRAFAAAGKTWKAYMESLPSVGYTGGDVYPYFKHHNPFAYMTDVLGSSAETANLVPFTQLASDMSVGALPNFAFIAPNAEDDAHDCPTGGSVCLDSDKLTAADNWLKNNIDPLIKSPALANSLFIIVFDESLDVDVVNGGVFVSILPVSLIRDESQPPGISQSFLLIAYIVAAWDFCKGAARDARFHLRMKFARGAQLPISGLSAVLLVRCRRQRTSAERFRKHKAEYTGSASGVSFHAQQK